MVNHNRLQYLLCRETLRVPFSSRKSARVEDSTVLGDRLRAQFPNQVWALDFPLD